MARQQSSAHTARIQAAWARIKAGHGFIYVAEIIGTETVKIGFALNPRRRMADCAGFYTARKRRVIAFVQGSIAAEQALHKALKPHSIRGETYHRSILTHAAIPAELRSAA